MQTQLAQQQPVSQHPLRHAIPFLAAGVDQALSDYLSMHDFPFIHDYRMPRDPSTP